MIAYAVRKEGETNDKIILRYKKAFFQTRTANQLKNTQQHQRSPSKRKTREQAIIRAFYRKAGKR